MTRTERQWEKCELARRQFVERAGRCAVLECDFVKLDEGGGETVWAPRPFELLAQAGVPWGQVADLRDPVHGADCRDSQIIALFGREEAPEAVRRLAGVAVRPASELDWDRLIPPIADTASGHFSYAHTRLYAQDAFQTDYNPLTNSPDWTGLEDANWVKAEYGAVRPIFGSGVNINSRYRFDRANMANLTADYSVEAFCQQAYDSSRSVLAFVTGRMTGALNYYFIRHAYAGSPNFQLRKRVNGVITALGAGADVATYGWNRLEMVGSTLKGYFEGAELTSASDASLTAAGYAGQYWYIDQYATSGIALLDLFGVYVEAGLPAGLLGPLGARGQACFGLAR